MRPSSLVLPALAVCLTLPLAGCDEKRKASEQGAIAEVEYLAPILREDVAQVRRGLPTGAAKLAAALDPDTLSSLQGVQRAIGRARGEVHDLAVSKGTFFSFADATGTVVRSEADPDVLAGRSLLIAFPALKKAAEPTAGVVETFGEMKELRGVRTGPDLAWVAAAPVVEKGQSKGVFVTGWSFRAFAYHLETMLKMHITEVSEKQHKKVAPFAYVYVVKAGKAYGTPTTPDVNAKTIEDLDLAHRTFTGTYHEGRDITGRAFGLAAVKAPDLGDDAFLAILFSES